jgi:ketosteroid isomerase-like protein
MVAGMAAATEGPVVFRPTGLVAEGDRVAVEAESEATLKNGKVYRNEYSLVFEFVGDGRISRIREYTDTKKVHDLMFS